MFEGHKDLLGLKELSGEQIETILETAVQMKHIMSQPNKKTGHLVGKSVVTLFYENSTRTRLSFELAAKYMSAFTSSVSASGSSVSKGESLIDTARTIDVMGTDVIILRHGMSGAPHLIAKNVNACVINAGDGMNEHPTQALLDMFTIKEKRGKIEGQKIAIIGDILHSRVARSNIWGLTKLGAKVAVAAPSTLLPAGLEQTGIEIYTDIDKAIDGADAVMGLRIQAERQSGGLFPSLAEYSRFFGINQTKLTLAKPDALLLHPGPVNRGVELSPEAADSDVSVIDEQVTNGVAIRMAVLYLFTKKDV